MVKINVSNIKSFFELIKGKNLHQKINILRFSVSWALGLNKMPPPLHLVVASTNICNLKCAMCPRQDPSFKNELNKSFSLENYKMLIDALPGLISVIPEGLGEPFLHKEIFEMIEYAKDKNAFVMVHSNGTTLNKEMRENIFNSGLDELSISMDSFNKETYESIRVGANYDDVVRNIDELVKERNERKHPLKISLRPVFMVKTYKEMIDYVKKAIELKVDLVEFGDISILWDTDLTEKKNCLRFSDQKEEIHKIIKEVRRIAKENNFRISLPRLEQSNKLSRCMYPWTTVSVNIDGEVRPCCGIHKLSFGNVLKEDVNKIWNSKNFVRWRKLMRSKNPPKDCLVCSEF